MITGTVVFTYYPLPPIVNAAIYGQFLLSIAAVAISNTLCPKKDFWQEDSNLQPGDWGYGQKGKMRSNFHYERSYAVECDMIQNSFAAKYMPWLDSIEKPCRTLVKTWSMINDGLATHTIGSRVESPGLAAHVRWIGIGVLHTLFVFPLDLTVGIINSINQLPAYTTFKVLNIINTLRTKGFSQAHTSNTAAQDTGPEKPGPSQHFSNKKETQQQPPTSTAEPEPTTKRGNSPMGSID